jgi:hypothetical protein
MESEACLPPVEGELGGVELWVRLDGGTFQGPLR